MASPLRRIDPDTRYVITKDSGDNVVKVYDPDGNLVSLPIVTDGGSALKVSDMSSKELLGQIVNELKIMNFHLQILTDEEIEEIT